MLYDYLIHMLMLTLQNLTYEGLQFLCVGKINVAEITSLNISYHKY